MNSNDPNAERPRRRQHKTFSLHPDAFELLRWLADQDSQAEGSMSRKLELLIFAAGKEASDVQG